MQVLAVLALLALAPFIRPHAAETTPHAGPRFAIMDDYIRDSLAADWDRHEHDPAILERAYCLWYQRDIWGGEWAWRVTRITASDSVWGVTTHSIGFGCTGAKPGAMVATLHVHPDQTCLGDECYRGGPYAYQCLPSDNDRAFLQWRGEAFGMVQCGRESIVTYWP